MLLKLSWENKLDADGLRRLVASINRYLGEPDAAGDVWEAVGDAFTDARPFGAVRLLDGVVAPARRRHHAGPPPMRAGALGVGRSTLAGCYLPAARSSPDSDRGVREP